AGRTGQGAPTGRARGAAPPAAERSRLVQEEDGGRGNDEANRVAPAPWTHLRGALGDGQRLPRHPHAPVRAVAEIELVFDRARERPRGIALDDADALAADPDRDRTAVCDAATVGRG